MTPSPRTGRVPPARPPRTIALLAALVALLPLLAACQRSPRPGSPEGSAESRTEGKVLRIGAIPDQKPEQLNRLHGLVADELSAQLGVPVRYVPVVDYSAAVTAFRTGDLDLVWFGGLSGVQARLQTPGATVVAQRDIDAAFHSVFIANRAAGLKPVGEVQGLAQLRGRRVSFGSENSTSGTLMPLAYLAEAEVKPSEFAGGRPGYSGSHDATIALVQSGAYEAGAVNEQVWRTHLAEGKADPAKVEEIWRTPPYPDYHWVARPGLDRRFGPGFGDRLRGSILAWSAEDPEQEQILSLFGAERFIPAEASAYARIEAIGRRIGKIR